jgi:two-component system chemotaxis sensor kinase CheA
MKMDMTKYLDVFLEESKEHLESLNEGLLALEKNSSDVSNLNEIFRAAHTLKGMSSTMGFNDLADLTHHMEDVLSDLKEGLLEANSYVIDVLFNCIDRLQLMIDNITVGKSEEMDNTDLLQTLTHIKMGNYEAAALSEQVLPEVSALDKGSSELFKLNDYDMTILKEAQSRGFNVYYINVQIDSACLMKTVRAFMVFKTLEEEGEIMKSFPPAQEIDEGKFENMFELFLISKLDSDVLSHRVSAISEIQSVVVEPLDIDSLEMPAPSLKTKLTRNDNNRDDNNSEDNSKKMHKTKQTVRVDIERLDNLMNLVGELVMHKGRLEQIGSNQKIPDLHETIEQIDRISTDLQSVVMKVRMVPIEQVFNRFPRMVRDLAKDLGKEVDFIIEGKETELDRTVIDEIGDPLVHLLRNALDHGVELPQERVQKGKKPVGTVVLRARHEGNYVYIEVEDDGEGIDTDKVLTRAIEKGFVSSQQAGQMSKEDVISLLFTSGFSTSQNITDVSGRGVGLDVVKNKIESLNGEINVDAREGLGTRFRIKLPLTLAIIQALMVAVGQEIYAIPLSSVDETTMITTQDIKMVQNQEVIMLRGNILPLFRLATILQVPNHSAASEEMYVVVVRRGEQQIGLVVDTLIGQQEIVIKSLGKLLNGIPGIAGAIVAGDGNVRLILDITTLN